MRVHWLQHVPFEGLGSIRPWLASREAQLTVSRLHEGDRLPSVSEIDWLIVMGGPMSIRDVAEHPWLADEKRFIAEAVASSRVVLGICLGAQLVAAVLGAGVRPNRGREVGWFRVEPPPEPGPSPFAPLFSDPFEAFHWHGERFELPPGSVRLARSAACANQAFSIGIRVLGLQFHLETTLRGARALVENCPGDLVPGRWVQDEEEILSEPERFRRINERMAAVLERLGALAI